jgi:hypothetical protein
MKTTTATIDFEFQQDVHRLGLLSGSADTLDAFTTEYKRVLESNYNQMMKCANVEKVLSGVYKSRAEILKELLQQQLNHFGLAWPEPRARVQGSN